MTEWVLIISPHVAGSAAKDGFNYTTSATKEIHGYASRQLCEAAGKRVQAIDGGSYVCVEKHGE